MNLTARSVALPFATLGPDANTSVQRRPVYEYAQIRARKAFWVRCSVQVANSLVTRAMFYELIQQKPRQPPLVMSNYSTMIQEVASDVPKSHAVSSSNDGSTGSALCARYRRNKLDGTRERLITTKSKRSLPVCS
jgi:hypothetical protein